MICKIENATVAGKRINTCLKVKAAAVPDFSEKTDKLTKTQIQA